MNIRIFPLEKSLRPGDGTAVTVLQRLCGLGTRYRRFNGWGEPFVCWNLLSRMISWDAIRLGVWGALLLKEGAEMRIVEKGIASVSDFEDPFRGTRKSWIDIEANI